VLRLTPYNCQYNPIELAWADCKDYYNKHIHHKLTLAIELKKFGEKLFNSVPNKSGKHSEQEVKNDWHKYMGVHDVDDIPPFIINLNSDSSDSESDRSTDLDEPSTSNLRTSVDSESYGEEVTFMIVKYVSKNVWPSRF
jgi:hypothetical protein